MRDRAGEEGQPGPQAGSDHSLSLSVVLECSLQRLGGGRQKAEKASSQKVLAVHRTQVAWLVS